MHDFEPLKNDLILRTARGKSIAIARMSTNMSRRRDSRKSSNMGYASRCASSDLYYWPCHSSRMSV